MSAIQIVCAVAVPLLWGYQFVAIKVSVAEFRRSSSRAALPGHRAAAHSVRQTARTSAIRPYRSDFGFPGGLNFGLFYVGLELGSGSLSAVAYQLATPFTILLAWPLLAERPSLTRPPEW